MDDENLIILKEAAFYQKLAARKVKCGLCPYSCVIADGGVGICGVRENREGALYSLVYGKIVSSHVDPVEKKPLFHFLPGSRSYSIATAGCNLRCSFCQNYTISQLPRERRIVEGEERTPEDVVSAALKNHCQSISYTYTEPTIFFEFAYDTAKLARERGLKNVFVTNGFISSAPLAVISPYLDAANVDLKSFRDEFYKKVCGARLLPVLETLKEMKKNNLWVEVTTLIIPGLNDTPEELSAIANFIGNELGKETPWHVSGFYPTYKLLDRPPTPAQALIKARDIGLKAGLKYVYSGNVAIAGAEDTYCAQCGAALIGRQGFQIVYNEMKDGKCSRCRAEIEGVWN